MRSYLDLIPISAGVRKKQNKMTIICIILAVFLVSGVFSMADMGSRAEKLDIYARYGNWHIKLHDIPENTAKLICTEPDIAVSSWFNSVNAKIDKEFYINGKKTALCGSSEEFVNEIYSSNIEGDFPKNIHEVMLTSNAGELFDINIGDIVIINTPSGNLEYTVSGFKEDSTAVMHDSIIAFMNKEAYECAVEFTGEEISYDEYYIRFNKYINIRNAIDNIKKNYDLTDDSIAENAAVIGLEGFSVNSYFIGLYGIALFLFILVLTAGVLMISSSMNGNVSQRTEFFGMMRCIGASKQQIIRFVRLEAINWCKTAVPIGILAAVLITWILCALMRFLIGGEFEQMPMFGISPIGIIFGAVVGIVTVLIAAQSPAKRAAKVSPLAAVSGNADKNKNIHHAVNIHLGKIDTSIGVYHAVSAKKNLILMTLSFAVSIIMFLCFSSFLGFVEHALPSLRSYSPDITIIDYNGTNYMGKDLKDKIYEVEGVKDIYGNMFARKISVNSNADIDEIDLISYDEYMLDWSKKALVSGDLSKILGDSRYVAIIHNKTNRPIVGDKIQIGNNDVEVACVLSNGVGVGSGMFNIVCSEETFIRLTGNSNYSQLNIKLNSNVTEKNISDIRDITKGYSVIDYRENNRQNKATYYMFSILVYGFLVIISMITAVNVINSISMSVSAKIKQYAIMRAVGMSIRQLIKVIAAETVVYAAFGVVVGCLVGVPLNKMFFEKMVTSHFGEVWEIPYVSIFVILIIVILACFAAIFMPLKRIKNMSVVDAVSEK